MLHSINTKTLWSQSILGLNTQTPNPNNHTKPTKHHIHLKSWLNSTKSFQARQNTLNMQHMRISYCQHNITSHTSNYTQTTLNYITMQPIPRKPPITLPIYSRHSPTMNHNLSHLHASTSSLTSLSLGK